ncbi:Glycerol kinase [Vanrija albida]|uniref:glycerol kinase n=1 Tax=Vanrija albida TaxID=181172 RepID=A0ABR3PXL5_9TREE
MTIDSKPEYIVSVDVGTTSTRAIAFDATAAVVATHQIEYDQLYPQPGWHEQRPADLIGTVHLCLDGVAAALAAKGIGLDQVPGIGITNQRETTCVWSRSTGLPLYNAIAWPDTRNTGTVHELASRSPLGTEALKAKTGLPLSTYFSGTKVKWLLDNVPEVRTAHDTDDLMFGTVETWILWNLTGGVHGGLHLTDVTNASRTMLMDLRTTAWDPECLAFFGVREAALPRIVSNAEIYGSITSGAFIGKPVAGMIGDQQAALVGNKCVEQGSAKNTYGTGAFMLFNTGDRPVPSTHGLLTTPAFRVAGQTAYALEGSIAVAGSSIKWLRDQMEIISTASDIDPLARKVENTGGVYFVPAFSGLFAPYWDDSAAGTLVGMSAYTNRAHIARATLEATCFQTRAILQAMAKDSGHKLSVLRVDGGMTNSDLCMQLQADILGIDVERPVMRESTALGSAICAGVALKRFGWDLARPETLREVNVAGRETFRPQNDDADRAARWRGWERAVERAMHWKE